MVRNTRNQPWTEFREYRFFFPVGVFQTALKQPSTHFCTSALVKASYQ